MTSWTASDDCDVELGIGEEEFIIEGQRSGEDSFEDGLHGTGAGFGVFF